jgi:parvulin-like peptidyl-prolyl isomerase
VRHILVKTEAEAKAIRQDLQAGRDFAELAKAHSEDVGSRDKGGDLGAISRGQTEPEFEEEIFRLKAGEVSQVVKTQSGYHIIEGGARGTASKPYEEVRDQIRQALVQIRQRETFQGYLAELERQAKTEVFEDRLR